MTLKWTVDSSKWKSNTSTLKPRFKNILFLKSSDSWKIHERLIDVRSLNATPLCMQSVCVWERERARDFRQEEKRRRRREKRRKKGEEKTEGRKKKVWKKRFVSVAGPVGKVVRGVWTWRRKTVLLSFASVWILVPPGRTLLLCAACLD